MQPLIRWLARHTNFVEAEISGLGQLVGPGQVAFDIGAEYGLYTHVLAHLVGPSGAVFSVEPLPGAFRILSAGLAAARRRNVTARRLALGARAEEVGSLSLPRRRGLPVHGRAFLTTGAHGEGPNAEFGSSCAVQVRVSTLDDFCAQQRIAAIDFIKADVEGAELAVLEGGAAVISRCCPTLLLEIEERHLAKYGTTPAAVVGWLEAQGYRLTGWRDGCWRPVEAVSPGARNYLFMHPRRRERRLR